MWAAVLRKSSYRQNQEETRTALVLWMMRVLSISSAFFFLRTCYCNSFLHIVLIFWLLVFLLFLSLPHATCPLYFQCFLLILFSALTLKCRKATRTPVLAVLTFANHRRIHNVPLLSNTIWVHCMCSPELLLVSKGMPPSCTVPSWRESGWAQIVSVCCASYLSRKLQEEHMHVSKNISNSKSCLGATIFILFLLFCFVSLRSEEDDSWLHWHGSLHYPVWVDHRCAGVLQTAGAHAVRGWTALPNGRWEPFTCLLLLVPVLTPGRTSACMCLGSPSCMCTRAFCSGELVCAHSPPACSACSLLLQSGNSVHRFL